MKHLCLCLIIGISSFSGAFGQLLTVGDQNVSKAEFVRLYEKNTPNPNYGEKSLREYLDLLITYKLKVQEALDQNLDKLPDVRKELKHHADQLAQPYLTDRALLEEMLKEVYDHSSQDVHARQVMIRCSLFAKPQDTLAAFKTAMRIRDRLVKGEDFEKVTLEESEKSDMVVTGGREEKRVSASDLRYFSAFAMPYSIEKYAFTSKIGDYSMPLRSDIGYHIVQTLDRQQTLGKINASQIFLNIPEGVDERLIKRKADSLYYLIINGDKTFEQVAKDFSDDKLSGIRGGRMAEFNITRIEPQFAAALYKMPLEVVSRPFRAEKGYHIVILHSVTEMGTYDIMRPELLYRLQRDSRADLIKQSFVNALLKTYPVVEVKDVLKKFASKIDSSQLDGLWMYDTDKYSDSVLCKVGNQVATFENFGKYIEDNQLDYHPEEEYFMTFIERNYRRYIGDLAILCETENVGKKYDEFNRDFNEYRDGVLTYEITNRKVWGKSLEDTVGLYDYYDSQKHCYMWPARLQALIFRYDVRYVNTDNVQKFLTASFRKRLSAEQIIEQANKNFDPKYISVTVNVYEPGQNKFADRVDWTQPGLSRDIAAGGYDKGFVYIYNYYPPTCKSLEDVRGIMVGQFQMVLEKEWLQTLSEKYNVRISEAEFKQLIKK